ncbi:aspartate aminotransferase family protein [Acidiferrobacter sp.]|uniref:aspartate aminotransferase family protein n=1 Tax=Acidiferrobacter sp. TaxID=1872107 RepID=UPI0026275694|nr:aspartate aminotransferase family protein [Acidiferrobacter sp.]
MPTEHHLMTTYGRLPVAFTHGEGAWLWDESGRRYLDGLAGVAVNGLGHAHPAIVEAVCAQARRLIHVSNWYENREQEALAERLCAVSGMDRAFFANSGAEANEAALKLARLHGHRKEVEAPAVIVVEGSFHGRTLGTLSASGSRKVQAGFEPLVPGFRRVPFNDLDAVRQVGARDQTIVAVLVEPILGEGGIQIPDAGYLTGLRQICDEAGWLLILDEIQTGLCRSGAWFAWQLEQARPDVMTVAKALGNGVPIGACLARGAAAELFHPGQHGSTFGGNPLATAVGHAVLETLDDMRAWDRAATLGQRLLARLRERLSGTEGVKAVRGRGLLIGVELDRPAQAVMRLALDRGLLLNVTAERVVRLLPPLILSDDQAGLLADGTADAICEFLAS